MKHFKNLAAFPSTISVDLPVDGDGWLGRECPVESCKRYFKITPGTGIEDHEACRCPYCGHEEHYSHYQTPAQIDYVVSVGTSRVMGALLKDLKSMEFDHRPRPGSFGIGMSLKVTGHPTPIQRYSEKDLETEVVCNNCTLRYAIYGVFGYCPDCGAHNNLEILDANLKLASRLLALASNAEADVARLLVENALQNCVSAFDGWGRATCQAFKAKAANPTNIAKASFQNIERAHTFLKTQFGFDADVVLGASKLKSLNRAFQQRHVIAHRMGVVDADYLRQTNDQNAREGHRIMVAASDIKDAAETIRMWANALMTHLEAMP